MKYGLYLVFVVLANVCFGLAEETERNIEKGKESFLQGNHEKSLDFFSLAVSESDKHLEELGKTYFEIGKFYADNAINDLALKYYLNALDESKRTSNDKLTQEIYNRIGGVYYNRMYYLEAKKFWIKSSEINKAISNDLGLSSNFNNLGEVERLNGNYAEAIEMYRKAYKIKENLGDSLGMGTVLTNLGVSYFYFNKLDSGRVFLEQSYAISEKLNSINLKQYVYQSFGEYYQAQDRYKQSIDWYHRSLSLLKIKKNPDNALAKDIYIGLTVAHKSLNQLDSALFYQTKQTDLMFDFFEEEKKNIRTSAEVRSSMIKKDNEINTLKQKSRNREIVSYVIISVLFIIIFFAYIVIRQRNKVIERKNRIITKEKEFIELRSRFISTASHQFRTPLAVIQSSIALIDMQKDGMNDELKVKFDKSYQRILESIDLLTSLMDEVLTIERINTGKISIAKSSIDAVALCKKIVDRFNEDQEEGEKVELIQIGDPVTLPLNERLMEQAVSNILSNALRYSEGSPKPEITIKFNEDTVSISIKDNGIGIPKDEIKHLFEPFYRASNASDYLGIGLCLTITNQYVQLMDGKVTVKSVLHEGSEFTIHFNR
jgi:signal transduction histidine kinase